MYAYGTDGRMESTSSHGIVTTYRYNALGQRVAKIGESGPISYYVYDQQGRLLGEYDGNGSVIQETVYLGDTPVAVIKPGTSEPDSAVGIYYIYADHLHTARVITRAIDNKILWRWDSTDPFGLSQPEEIQTDTGKFAYNARFPGQLFDKETNNYYNYFRDYDPSIGRYVQSDPIGLAAGPNTYAYAGSNPLQFADPAGLEVTMILNTNSGTLSVTDNNTGANVKAGAFTGGRADYSGRINHTGTGLYIPAPAGTYYIVPNPNPFSEPGWFGLMKQDDRIDDYLNDNGKQRSGIRLHKGTRSEGCVTVNSYAPRALENWQTILTMLENTSTTRLNHRTGPHWWNGTSSTKVYGKLIIQ
jgi:RHS repeat-associated protein